MRSGRLDTATRPTSADAERFSRRSVASEGNGVQSSESAAQKARNTATPAVGVRSERTARSSGWRPSLSIALASTMRAMPTGAATTRPRRDPTASSGAATTRIANPNRRRRPAASRAGLTDGRAERAMTRERVPGRGRTSTTAA
jgi:hypothetical protein